jgi:hypothetical protein
MLEHLKILKSIAIFHRFEVSFYDKIFQMNAKDNQ